VSDLLFSRALASAALGLSVLAALDARRWNRRQARVEAVLWPDHPARRHVVEGHPFAPTVEDCALCTPTGARPFKIKLTVLRFKINRAVSRVRASRQST
jgi:hypothetical protein